MLWRTGEEKPTKVIKVWFEDAMLIEEGELVTITKWMDSGSGMRGLKIYNEDKGIPNESDQSTTVTSSTKHEGQVEGIVKEIKEWNSSRVEFLMRGHESQLEEEGF